MRRIGAGKTVFGWVDHPPILPTTEPMQLRVLRERDDPLRPRQGRIVAGALLWDPEMELICPAARRLEVLLYSRGVEYGRLRHGQPIHELDAFCHWAVVMQEFLWSPAAAGGMLLSVMRSRRSHDAIGVGVGKPISKTASSA